MRKINSMKTFSQVRFRYNLITSSIYILFGINLEYRDDWVEIIRTLAADGPQAITLGKIKPFISKT